MRTRIETVYNCHLRQPMKVRLFLRALARQLGMPPSTFHDEFRRGIVPKPNLSKDRKVRDYYRNRQAAIEATNLDKDRPMPMNSTIAKLLHIEIANRHRSPCDVLAHLRKQSIPELPSERSVYAHIHHGGLDIFPSQLPCKPTPDRKKPSSPHRNFKIPENLSIEERPDTSTTAPSSDTGNGHVVSGLHGKGGLFVLIERKTLLYIIKKLRCISQSEVLRFLWRAIHHGKIVKVLTITTRWPTQPWASSAARSCLRVARPSPEKHLRTAGNRLEALLGAMARLTPSAANSSFPSPSWMTSLFLCKWSCTASVASARVWDTLENNL